MIRFDQSRRRGLLLGGFAGSVLFILAALLLAQYPAMERFIAAVDALGQIWIAVLLLFLAHDEFEFNKRASERQLREASFDRRADLRRRWQQSSLQIGFTQFNEENFERLARLPPEIKDVFDKPTGELARQAVIAARAARNRARLILRDGGDLRKDDSYRSEIVKYREMQSACWHAMAEKLALDD